MKLAINKKAMRTTKRFPQQRSERFTAITAALMKPAVELLELNSANSVWRLMKAYWLQGRALQLM